MNIAEVYQALENLENGQELISAIKGETSRLNNEAKTTREKLQQQITELTGERDTLTTRVTELEQEAGANTGANSPEYKTLEKQLKAMSEKFELAETKAKEAEAKRIQSEIMAQTLDAFTKANAVDPQEFARLVANDIKVQADGTYGYEKEDGTIGSIQERTTEWLQGKTWAVKATGNTGSGQGGNSGNGDTIMNEFAAAAGVKL
nr:MAG TPA: minor structural protein [Caudoviricetes sp.]